MAGRRVYKPGERGVCVHAGSRAGGRRGSVRARAAGDRPDVSVLKLQLHGERDQLPPEAVPGGGQQGQILGPMPTDR
ncbi:hypothetical protein G9C98_005191 [Cotesia typhae]|uniref:Uncharacterized protein n=1 Tax=Cotesia typhae TaxID=2053667 RepID=A0A8J5UU58_9HYME|nr:hypothetical protein G9C98_005191 [Cotesia typhae]